MLVILSSLLLYSSRLNTAITVGLSIVFLAVDNPAKSERHVVLLPCKNLIAHAHAPFSNLHITYVPVRTTRDKQRVIKFQSRHLSPRTALQPRAFASLILIL
jgi:hypothetical protein